VWFGWATPGGLISEVQHFAGDRATVRAATVQHALQTLLVLLQKLEEPAR
jgi:nicotinamide-nucleotide amidase